MSKVNMFWVKLKPEHNGQFGSWPGATDIYLYADSFGVEDDGTLNFVRDGEPSGTFAPKTWIGCSIWNAKPESAISAAECREIIRQSKWYHRG